MNDNCDRDKTNICEWMWNLITISNVVKLTNNNINNKLCWKHRSKDKIEKEISEKNEKMVKKFEIDRSLCVLVSA